MNNWNNKGEYTELILDPEPWYKKIPDNKKNKPTVKKKKNRIFITISSLLIILIFIYMLICFIR